MKNFILLLFLLVFSAAVRSQDSTAVYNYEQLPPHGLRLIATVRNPGTDVMVIQVEHIVEYSRGVTSTPSTGDEITVRLPGRNSPGENARIEVDLMEKIDIGAMPSSYIMLNFRTIE